MTDDRLWQEVQALLPYARLHPEESWTIPGPTAAKGRMPYLDHRTVAEVDRQALLKFQTALQDYRRKA